MPPPAPAPVVDYRQSGSFDRAIFQTELLAQFGKGGRYNADALPDLFALLTQIELDGAITDIRWTAYMLATVYWETTYPTLRERPARNKQGKPILDKAGNPVMLKSYPWLMTMRPVDEVGKGKTRDYHEPVKVKKLADGSVRVTEQDGDQFAVKPGGTFSVLTSATKINVPKATVGNKFEGGGVMGTKDGGKANATYDADDGVENAYYGRGYVQLTWWSNYAAASARLGRGLDLLLDPELVKQTDIAYEIMSRGMRLGEGFANGHTFAKYFTAKTTNYTAARAMVNGSDHAADIAAVATKFEAILLKARPAPVVPR
jgi:hypothetical protein